MLDHVEEIVLVLSSFGSLLSSTLLDDELIESKLLSSSLQDSLLHGVLGRRSPNETTVSSRSVASERRREKKTHLGDEPENVDLLGLSDPMSSVHGLEIGLRVPVRRDAKPKEDVQLERQTEGRDESEEGKEERTNPNQRERRHRR